MLYGASLVAVLFIGSLPSVASESLAPQRPNVFVAPAKAVDPEGDLVALEPRPPIQAVERGGRAEVSQQAPQSVGNWPLTFAHSLHVGFGQHSLPPLIPHTFPSTGGFTRGMEGGGLCR